MFQMSRLFTLIFRTPLKQIKLISNGLFYCDPEFLVYVFTFFYSQTTLLYLKTWTGKKRLTFSLASRWCLCRSYLLAVKQILPHWAHLFIRDPLRLVQGEGTVEGAVLRHHAETAGAPDEFLSVGNCRHSASAAVSLLWTGRILSLTNSWAYTPFAMIDRRYDESEHSVRITCVGVCFDSCSPHEGGNIKFCSTRHFFFYFCPSIKDTRSYHKAAIDQSFRHAYYRFVPNNWTHELNTSIFSEKYS